MVDSAAAALLESSGWQSPDAESLPTGHDLIDHYVDTAVVASGALPPHVRYNARVIAVGRKDFDKVRTKGRDQQPFEIAARVGRDDRGARGD